MEIAAEIVTSFVSNNSLPRGELAAVIEAVHTAIQRLAAESEVAPVSTKPFVPAVSIRKSITPDYLICLEDGKRFKSLRRHLATLGMTPEQYRTKWDLPSTYPMVAANYAAQRSALAKAAGLGQSRMTSFAAASEVVAAPQSSVETIEAVAPEPPTAAKSKAKPKRQSIAASPEEPAKRKAGRPRIATA